MSIVCHSYHVYCLSQLILVMHACSCLLFTSWFSSHSSFFICIFHETIKQTNHLKPNKPSFKLHNILRKPFEPFTHERVRQCNKTGYTSKFFGYLGGSNFILSTLTNRNQPFCFYSIHLLCLVVLSVCSLCLVCDPLRKLYIPKN